MPYSGANHSPMFSPFQEFLKQTINRHGMQQVVEASRVCAKFSEIKPDIFPEDPENQIIAKHFKNNILTLQVPDSVWANEVVNRQSKIIAEVNAKYGQEVIQRIKTELEQIKQDGLSL